MLQRLFGAIGLVVLFAGFAAGQDPVAPDATGASAEPASLLPSLGAPPDVDLFQPATWKRFSRDVLADQKRVVLFPRELRARKRWIAAAALAATTAALVAIDPHDTPYFRRTDAFHRFNAVASGVNTSVAMAALPAVFYAVSAVGDDRRGKQTVLAAAEAIADVQILTFGMKTIGRRFRPVDVPEGGNFSDTWFKADWLAEKSFPSGHTTTAFALAQVFAERYRSHRWVPWVAYGAAATVGFSRLTLQSHFPSDVFAGAVLGMTIAHGLVLPRHRTPSP